MRVGGAHIGRRRAIVAMLVLAAVLEAAFAFAVLSNEDSDARVANALPLHPVAGTFEPDATKLDDCDDQTCVEQAFGNLAFYRGPKRALSLFDKTYPGFSDPDCHRVVHTIGSAALARNRGDVAKTFAEGSSSCFSGYYHGVLERSLIGVQSFKPRSLAPVARDLCSGREVRSSIWLRFQCLHGLGHGLMITTGYSLPLSLEVCDRLRTPWEETTCNGGVFMENIATSYAVRSRWLRDDDPVYPCNAVAHEDKLKCYELATSRVLRVVDADWEKTAEICAQVEDGWAWACFRSLGRDAAVEAHYELNAMLDLCTVARPYGRKGECVTGAAETAIGNFGNAERASELCSAAPISIQRECFTGIGTLVVRYWTAPARLRAGCRAIAPSESSASACMRGGAQYLAFVARER